MQKVTNVFGVGRVTRLLVAGRRKGAELKSGVLPGLQMKARRKMKKDLNTRRGVKLYFSMSHSK
jgi:hypothetical protein